MSNHLDRLRNNGDNRLSYCGVTLRHMSICAGVVVAVTFQQVDDTPHAETSAEGDHEGLKNGDCLIEEFHTSISRNHFEKFD